MTVTATAWAPRGQGLGRAGPGAGGSAGKFGLARAQGVSDRARKGRRPPPPPRPSRGTAKRVAGNRRPFRRGSLGRRGRRTATGPLEADRARAPPESGRPLAGR